MTEEQIKNLMLEAKAGNGDAFALIYKEYLTPIYRFIYFRVSNKTDAEDLTQEVFLKVFNSLERFKINDGAPIAYFYTVARNLLIDSYRKNKIGTIDVEDVADLSAVDGDPEKDYIFKENVSKLRQALDKISDSEREVIILKYINDYTNNEISKVLGKSEDAIRQLQSRGIRALRGILIKEI